MPEISLKEYFSKLNTLLTERAVDEVLLHCRQILQFYPKNVTAYRFLGRGLVTSGRWEEGREALRRVLSVIPDDYAAHLALSEANERLGRSDEAIWHLERAFEQHPNDKEIIDALRALYSLHRNINNLKVQLTSAAVARQYARSGAYTQAVDTLRSALSRMNERLDLKLLLAQILEQHGQQEEAAELALEVLGVLPDCLEANKIMAELWLSVNRPSDAQRYVNRLEAVDPYLAVEVAQGYPPEDDAFRLDELDYVRTAQSELASSRLDWLQEISAIPAPAVEAAPDTASDDLSDWASAMLSGRTPVEPEEVTVDEPTSARFAAIAEEDEAEEADFAEMFGQPEPADAEALEAMFASPPVELDDPMAWLHEAGVEIVESSVDEPAYEDLFGDDELPAIGEDDPMAWLRDSAAEPDIVQEQPAAQTAADDEGDPMAWLRDSRSDPDSTQEQPVAQTIADDDDDPFAWRGNDAGVTLDEVLSDAPEEDGELEPFDWLQDEQLLDEALSLDGLNADDPAAVWDSLAGSSTADAQDDQFETAFPEESPAEAVVPGARRGLTAMLQEANLDWISKPAEEPTVDDDMDEWLSQFGAATEPKQSITDNPDWLLELEQPQTGGQVSAAETREPDLQFAVEAAGEETGMSEHLHQAGEPEDEDVDWMRDLVSQPDAEAADEFEAAGGDAEKDDGEALEAEMPDWMAELEPEAESDETDEPEAEAAAADLPWLADAAPAEAQLEEAEMPDWLSELEPEAEAEPDAENAVPEPELEPPDMSDFPWMAGDAAEEAAESDDEEAVAAEMPDWLSEMAPDEDADHAEPAVQAEPAAEEDLSWLSDESLEDVEAAVDGGIPDWLSDLQPEEAEPVPEAEPAEPESEPEPALEQPAASDFPWMEGEGEEAEQPAAEYSEFPWMGKEADTGEESEPEAVAEGATPDWLSDLQPEEASDAAALEEVIPFSTEPLPEPEPAAESIPSWLSELEPEEQDSETEQPSSEDDLSWLDEEAGEADAVAGGMPDWLSGAEEEAVAAFVGDEDDEAGDFEPSEEAFAFLSEADDASLEASPAHNAPDWLNAMVPGLDVDYEPGEDEFADEEMEESLDDDTAQREFAWLTNLVEEEMAATERPDFAFSRPPIWLGSPAAFLDDGSPDDELPDWPSDDADADVPKWLR